MPIACRNTPHTADRDPPFRLTRLHQQQASGAALPPHGGLTLLRHLRGGHRARHQPGKEQSSVSGEQSRCQRGRPASLANSVPRLPALTHTTLVLTAPPQGNRVTNLLDGLAELGAHHIEVCSACVVLRRC
jgi:hypothetical protein